MHLFAAGSNKFPEVKKKRVRSRSPGLPGPSDTRRQSWRQTPVSSTQIRDDENAAGGMI